MGFFPDGAQQSLPYVIEGNLTVLGMETGSRFAVLIGMDVLGQRELIMRGDATGGFIF